MPSQPEPRGSTPLPTAGRLNPTETARYSRHLLLPEIGLEGQGRLKASRVLVIGAGGLGSPASIYLAAAGVGTIGLADHDRVESHNLQRQILHGDGDIGRPKIESARDRLSTVNPHISLRVHPEGITPRNALELVSQYDVVIDGSDNFPTRYLVTDACHLARRPLVHGSVYRFEGQVSVFSPASGGPCYRCLFPEAPQGEARPNCAEAGVLGALCGLIGSLQAVETVKTLLGIGRSASGTLLVIDALNFEFRTLRIDPNPDCPLCSSSPTITQIQIEDNEPVPPESTVPSEDEMEPIEVSRYLATDPTAVVVDVREPAELAVCKLAGSTDIPMRQIPGALESLPQKAPLFILCHHGNRSRMVVQFLRRQGFPHVINIKGGINAWAQTVDTNMARY
jgi:adenylyltransferase/sulfurtransferase